MNALTEPFNPISRAHAYWLRDVYANIARFIGRDGVSVIWSTEGIKVEATEAESGGGGPAFLPNFMHRGGLLSTTQLNRIIEIYNAARAMIGRGLAVIKSADAFKFTNESAERGGGQVFPFVPKLQPRDPRQTIFNRSVRGPLVMLANAWARAIATEPIELVKSHDRYVISGEFFNDPECLFVEDWEDEPTEGLAISTLQNWDVLLNNIDVLGPGGFDPVPGNGKYIDLSGTLLQGQWAPARIRTKNDITLRSGRQYILKYTLAGDNRGGAGTQDVNVQFHTVNATHTLASTDGATTWEQLIVGPHTGKITIENTATTNADGSLGPVSIYVSVCRK